MANDHADHHHSHGSHSHGSHSHGSHGDSHHEDSHHGDGDLAEMLDLDAEVLHDYYREVIGWAGSLVPENPRIVDLGAGTGTGTLALARHLPTADLTAVDMDEEMLERLRHRAAQAGLADRIRTVQADLDGDWPGLGPADLVWASASMHHLADPARTLAQVYATLRPGGTFMITELDAFPRFLKDAADAADAAVEERCHAELARFRQEAGMHMGEDWGARLKAAGFELEGERRFDIELPAPLPPNAVRYAQVTLQRTRSRLADHLTGDDLAALDRIVATAPDRADLTIRATRDVWIGRRP
ncbi:SAM-dependent methyltransferase [Actinoplanes tereljensis]|uniref:SAM-dependent methyltransferase n=1 Tax=Paractinoplanes tereljensis TaxID=571912 RepID=A0A919NLY7_9ACTN|nr:class I SAM-dependent methyltransferase [Actinoplanes tereljensis]GIF20399.1 SAM-dependent methyltransferase [Actinoplanes tereljensis]